jgi:hypothetical protein
LLFVFQSLLFDSSYQLYFVSLVSSTWIVSSLL